MQMNIAEAKAKLSELIAAAEGEVTRVPDFLEPMPNEEIALWT